MTNNISFSVAVCSSFILLGVVLFSQILGIQAFSYPLLLFNTFLFFKWSRKSCILILVFTALSSITYVSVLFRGGSTELALELIRFFYGFLLTAALISLSRKKFTIVHWFLFSGLCVAELLFSNFSIQFSYVSRFINETYEGRNLLDNYVYRVLGPSLNSSVSGSLCFILAFFLLIKQKSNATYLINAPYKEFKCLVIFLLILAGFSCGSGTANVTLLFLISAFCITSKSKIINLIKNKKWVRQILGICLLSLLLILAFEAIFPKLLAGLFFEKIANDYFQTILELKSSELLELFHTQNCLSILFGITYEKKASIICFGGDFVLLSLVRELGLIALSCVLILPYYFTRRKYWYLISAFLISSVHYGTAFSLTGQIILGYLIALEEQ